MKYRQYTNEDIIYHVARVKSMGQLLKALGLKAAGGNYINMKRKLQVLQINTDHWTGQAWSHGQQQKDWIEYKSINRIKQHLISLRGHQCETCQHDTWLEQPITLEVHHIDGDRTNNRVENLQLLCPNCHSCTDNWRGRNNMSV